MVDAIDVARAAKRRALENFGFSALYNLVAAPAAVFGLINPLIAAHRHVGLVAGGDAERPAHEPGGPPMSIMLILLPISLALALIGLGRLLVDGPHPASTTTRRATPSGSSTTSWTTAPLIQVRARSLAFGRVRTFRSTKALA